VLIGKYLQQWKFENAKQYFDIAVLGNITLLMDILA